MQPRSNFYLLSKGRNDHLTVNLDRVIIPSVVFIFYAVMANDAWAPIIVLPSFLSIMVFSIKIQEKYLTPNDIINFICFLFFVIAPIQVFSDGYFDAKTYVSGFELSYRHFVTAQAIFLVFYLSYMFSLNFFKEKSKDIIEIYCSKEATKFILIIIIVSFSLHVISYGSINNLLSSRYNRDLGETSFISLIWKAVQICSTLVLFSGAMRSKSTILYKVFVGVSLIFLFISINPFNIARNVLFNAWFPLILVVLKGKIKPIFLHLLFFFLVIIVMPLFNYTSREGLTLYESLLILREGLSEALNRPFSDVFDMLAMAVNWFESHNFHYGDKTLGLLLFFIPRAIWTGKATLTGLDIGHYIHFMDYAGTANLSFFIGGDFYADFGLLGVLFGGVFTAYIVFLSVYRRQIYINGCSIKTLMFISALPILIRGPIGANVGLFFLEMIFLSVFPCLLTRKRANDHSHFSVLYRRRSPHNV
ncbi:hypothetical protein SAMN02982989_2926 [Xaviernesmea oryzae]|uniref:O-antigen polysaccharide polymerase Wzy n=1 Tax=Xaviernesmea oryzae TaxID=464029 RepID=A0A1X7FFB2_9HYPH|nr:oligosaccharide repeat unit polymerase [Xaviernesmea oryzae]SMF51070.1 hypothetical protein SAMN02982989_2926 [Xaviernesmea oryzae]